MTDNQPLLFSPLAIRGVTLPNRIVVAPMAQYSAVDGVAGDWHFANLSKYALGGAGLIFSEALAVERRGMVTPGCSGLWNDDQVAPWKRINAFLKSQGAVPGVQLAHSGRRGSAQPPVKGGRPLTEADDANGHAPWPTAAPSAEPWGEGWPTPRAMGHADIADVVEAFAAAARNAVAAGFEVAEVNGAHGYLINSFLSPMSNHRNDAYGGDRTGRMRFACEVTEAVRAAWPDDKPLFFRVSAIDGVDIGWNMDDTVALARELKTLGVDVIDCSSGGVAESVPMIQRLARGPAFQVPFADQVRREAGIMSMAVGMITEAEQAEAILREDRTDLIAIARELMSNPNWPLHAAEALGVEKPFDLHPEQYGWWLELRARRMAGQS